MSDPHYNTWRVRRRALERLLGYDRAYETEIREGLKSVRGRGPTKEASLADAERQWVREAGAEQQ
jgi:hypothetical protein